MLDDTFDPFTNYFVLVYLDDILIFTEILEEHRIIVKQVLKILQDNKLSCKPEKCEFEKTRVDFLGVVVEQGQVHIDPCCRNGRHRKGKEIRFWRSLAQKAPSADAAERI